MRLEKTKRIMLLFMQIKRKKTCSIKRRQIYFRDPVTLKNDKK